MVYDDYDLSVAARAALAGEFEGRYPISYENIAFTVPADGSMWLKYDYLPVEKIYQSLDRKCISLIGMVQVGIVFSPDKGIDDARKLAKEIANFFEDGKILTVGYISQGAESHKVQKSDRGWLLPLRFLIRYDGK